MARRTGIAHLPLHSGRAPAWLFTRMTRLAREVAIHIVSDQGAEQLLRRLSDPFWFQAFGCVLGFDWHSSGVTTTVTGALKEALAPIGPELGVFAQGGKGATSRKTPDEIARNCATLAIDPAPLIRASRLAAKIDSAAVQDGYQLYHHAFFFTTTGHWCVVQQGMNDTTRDARRYHWLSETITSFVHEPHAAICSDARGEALNLVSAEHEALRTASVTLAAGPPEVVLEVVRRYTQGGPRRPGRTGHLPFDAPVPAQVPAASSPPTLVMPRPHALRLEALDPSHLRSILLSTYEHAPRDFEQLLGLEGVGARTLRALALVAEVIYGTPASLRDPARFAFAHGGKDGTPFPVDRQTYETTIDVLHRAMVRARVERSDKVAALKRLARFADAASRDVSPSGA